MSDSENEIDSIRNREMFENYLAAKKNYEKKKGKKDPKAKSAKVWREDQTSLPIYVLYLFKQTLAYGNFITLIIANVI